MNKSRVFFWVDLLQGVTFVGVVGSLLFGHGLLSPIAHLIHAAMGIVMLGLAALHLALHWKWIRSALFERKKELPPTVKANLNLDLWLFGLMTVMALTGLPNLLAIFIPGGFLVHLPFHVLHTVGGLILIALIIHHIQHHWKWIVAQLNRNPVSA